MKTLFLLCCALLFLCYACREKPPVNTKPVPSILEGKKIDVRSILSKKREGGDPVEALYEELTAKSEELQELEKQIKALQSEQNTAIDSFKRFEEKNKGYYDAAVRKLDAMKDSVVRKKIRTLIAESQLDFGKTAGVHIVLDSLIKKKTNTIHDLHIILKITKTLPLIREYQLEHLPTPASMEAFSLQLDSLKLRLDSLSRP